MVEEELRFLAGSRIVTGEVVDHVLVRSQSRGDAQNRAPPAHYPIVRYSTETGKVFQVQAREGYASARSRSAEGGVQSGQDARPVGTPIRVAYRPENPEDARTLGFMQQYFTAIILAITGLVFLLGVVAGLWTTARKSPSA